MVTHASAKQVIDRVERAGGSLELRDGLLKYQIPESHAGLIPAIRRNKPAIVELLQLRAIRSHVIIWISDNAAIGGLRVARGADLYVSFCEWLSSRGARIPTWQEFMGTLANMGFGGADGLVFALGLREHLCAPGHLGHGRDASK